MVNRRDAIAGSAGALMSVPLRSRAQTAGKVWRVGVFDFAPVSEQHPNALAFFGELRRLGYVRGENLMVERRDAGSQPDRLPAIARELVAWKPDLVTVSGGGPNLAMKAATSSIPMVMTGVADPVSIGLVASLARPGGNITGMTPIVPGGFGGKLLQLLHETVPTARRIALFLDPNNASHVQSQSELPPSVQRLGLVMRTFEVRNPADIETAIAAAQRERCQAVLILGGAQLGTPRLAQLVTAARLPLMSVQRLQTEAGGLMSYGPDFPDLYRRAAAMADRLMKGANPAEMPIEQPTKFDLVINLKTARALGLAIPQSVLLRADEVLQ